MSECIIKCKRCKNEFNRGESQKRICPECKKNYYFMIQKPRNYQPTTFATPIVKAPCDHEEVLIRTNMTYFTYKCIYCGRISYEDAGGCKLC